MKALLIGESRQGKIEDSTYELVGFAKQFGMESVYYFQSLLIRLGYGIQSGSGFESSSHIRGC